METAVTNFIDHNVVKGCVILCPISYGKYIYKNQLNLVKCKNLSDFVNMWAEKSYKNLLPCTFQTNKVQASLVQPTYLHLEEEKMLHTSN